MVDPPVYTPENGPPYKPFRDEPPPYPGKSPALRIVSSPSGAVVQVWFFLWHLGLFLLWVMMALRLILGDRQANIIVSGINISLDLRQKEVTDNPEMSSRFAKSFIPAAFHFAILELIALFLSVSVCRKASRVRNMLSGMMNVITSATQMGYVHYVLQRWSGLLFGIEIFWMVLLTGMSISLFLPLESVYLRGWRPYYVIDDDPLYLGSA